MESWLSAPTTFPITLRSDFWKTSRIGFRVQSYIVYTYSAPPGKKYRLDEFKVNSASKVTALGAF